MKRWKHLNNERGAAFLLVLLATGFVMTLALFMLESTQNANQQAQTISDLESARLLSEAGIDVYDHQLASAATEAASVEAVALPEVFDRSLDEGYGFSVSDVTTTNVNGALVVSYTSTGWANAETVELPHQTIISTTINE